MQKKKKKNLRPKSWISVDFDGFTYPTMKKGRRMSMAAWG